ncbi:FAD/NAD(P)-binding domain-containing protein [Daedalea quercina L-15889]|uniref:FAD/NAD(P)-binding domain-containing protein n=1 Tax=Daedalea quercina L-15889 TaxID=1314783 RepID=A0A165KTE4_9APHY|nr:FAD/NAD(P)-binding domain-containing protein [Daedalea quercina L-15889]
MAHHRHNNSHYKLRVAIVGGGIGGLSFAVALRKLCGSHVKIDLYEAAHAFTEVGAGIGVWPRVWHTMEALDLARDLSAIIGDSGDAGEDVEFRQSDYTAKGGSESDVPSCQWTQVAGVRTFHRAEFQAVLSAHLPLEADSTYSAHFRKRLSFYDVLQSHPEAIALNFADGTCATCDLLVGCDGIKSAVRGTLYQSQPTMAEPVWSGCVAYRSLIPREALAKVNPEHPCLFRLMLACGQNRHFVAFPVSHGKMVNVVAMVSTPEEEGIKFQGEWTRESSKEEVLEAYAGWEPLVRQVISCIDKTAVWAINVVPKLPTYVGERVALLGDAAHAMTPHQGSGAGQAIEDGFILASLLADHRTTRDTLPRVLQVYDSIRRPFSQDIERCSRECGWLYEYVLSPADVGISVGPTGDSPADELARRSNAAQQLLLWASETSLMNDKDKALQALDAALAT